MFTILMTIFIIVIVYEISVKYETSLKRADFSTFNRDRTAAYIEIWINAMRYRKCGFMDIRSTNRATAITWLLRRRPSLKSKWVVAGHRDDDDDDDNDDHRYDVPIYDDRRAAAPMIHGRSLAPGCPSHSSPLFSHSLTLYIAALSLLSIWDNERWDRTLQLQPSLSRFIIYEI